MANEIIITASPIAILAMPILATVAEKDLPVVCCIRRAIKREMFKWFN
jgi:hypothetical protein